MLVRSPLLTRHKWRELVPSWRLVCRCYDVFLWCYVCFVLLRFRLYVFVEAAAFRSIILRYAGAPIPTRVLEMSLFPSIFPLSLCMESTSYVLSFRMVFFYLVTSTYVIIQSPPPKKCTTEIYEIGYEVFRTQYSTINK